MPNEDASGNDQEREQSLAKFDNEQFENLAEKGKAMEYKVVPFDPVNIRTASSADAANQLQQLITSMANDGWNYLRLEAISATMPGTSGCFGIGAQPSSSVFFGMAVFER